MSALLWCVPRWERITYAPIDSKYVQDLGYSFRWNPPGVGAALDDSLLWVWLPGYCIFCFVIIVLCFMRSQAQQQKAAAQYWRRKWENTSLTGDTLLRASIEEPNTLPKQLLRAAEEPITPPEHLLLAVEGEEANMVVKVK